MPVYFQLMSFDLSGISIHNPPSKALLFRRFTVHRCSAFFFHTFHLIHRNDKINTGLIRLLHNAPKPRPLKNLHHISTTQLTPSRNQLTHSPATEHLGKTFGIVILKSISGPPTSYPLILVASKLTNDVPPTKFSVAVSTIAMLTHPVCGIFDATLIFTS